jgi:hypothetical protein
LAVLAEPEGLGVQVAREGLEAQVALPVSSEHYL